MKEINLKVSKQQFIVELINLFFHFQINTKNVRIVSNKTKRHNRRGKERKEKEGKRKEKKRKGKTRKEKKGKERKGNERKQNGMGGWITSFFSFRFSRESILTYFKATLQFGQHSQVHHSTRQPWINFQKQIKAPGWLFMQLKEKTYQSNSVFLDSP